MSKKNKNVTLENKASKANENIKSVDSADYSVPVAPNVKQYSAPFITTPKEFAMFGDKSLDAYTSEVEQAAREIRAIMDKERVKPKEDEVVEEVVPQNDSRCKASASSIFVFIFSVFTLAFLLLGKVIPPMDFCKSLFFIANGKSGIDIVMDFFAKVNGSFDTYELVTVVGVIVIALFSLITAIGSIATVKRRGLCGFLKVCCFLSFVGVIAIGVAVFAKASVKMIDIGWYAALALTLVNMLIAFFAKAGKKDKKVK